MSALLYRPDWETARQRMAAWWQGEDIGRPAMQVYVPRPEPVELIPALPEPEGWTGRYSTVSFPYRVNWAQRACTNTYYLGEAVPYVASGDLGPNSLALYLGCRCTEAPDTVWVEPCMTSPEEARFAYDPENAYWKFSTEAYRQVGTLANGKFLQEFPDFVEGLDTLAAMRGTAETLEDLLDRPEWVQACLRRITDLYFTYYDAVYDLIRDDTGGSQFWAWAPGRMGKFQCDFSAMISPSMFEEFMVPVLKEMTQRVDYCIYHWDGPGALPHHDLLLGIPQLNVLQWTAGAGAEPEYHQRWWPLYHKTFDAGKKIFIWASDIESLKALKREFGAQCKNFLLNTHAKTLREAEEAIQMMEC